MRIILSFFGLLFLTISCSTPNQSFRQEHNYGYRDLSTYRDSTLTYENIRVTGTVYLGAESMDGKADTLSHYIRIEIIDKKLFEQKQKSSVNLLIADNAIQKVGNVITLPVRDSIFTITDNPVDNETHRLYTYVGHVPSLNQFVLHGLYWETLDFAFIGKNSGRLTALFDDYPFIAPNKKYIISIYANLYDTSADFSLKRITKKGIEPVFITTFQNWMPYMDKGFYSTDGWLYFPVNHFGRFWDQAGNLNAEFQYMRIKVL